MKYFLCVVLFFISYVILDGFVTWQFIETFGRGWLWFWIAISAVGGVVCIKKQGFDGSVLAPDGSIRWSEIFRFFKILMSGILLILPGLLTDILGLILLGNAWFSKRRDRVPRIVEGKVVIPGDKRIK